MVSPLASRVDCGIASFNGLATAGFGGVFLHASSALTDSTPPPCSALDGGDAGTGGPKSGCPGTAWITTRPVFVRYWSTNARTDAGVTARYRRMSFCRYSGVLR